MRTNVRLCVLLQVTWYDANVKRVTSKHKSSARSVFLSCSTCYPWSHPARFTPFLPSWSMLHHNMLISIRLDTRSPCQWADSFLRRWTVPSVHLSSSCEKLTCTHSEQECPNAVFQEFLEQLFPSGALLKRTMPVLRMQNGTNPSLLGNLETMLPRTPDSEKQIVSCH